MDDFFRSLFEKIDKEELLNELKKDKDFNKLMGMMSELFGDNSAPTIRIELKPNDDKETHSLQIETEGSMHSIIIGLAEIVARVMLDMDEKGILRADAYENFGKLVKA